MSDIFREVDEDLRHEHYKRLWDRFGPYVIALAVLIVVGVGGWQAWDYWQTRSAESTGDRFIAALELSDQGQHQEALTAFEEIVADGSGDYPVLADFRVAAAKSAAGDTDGAVEAFDALAASSSTPEAVKPIARLRAALILVDTASLSDLESRIGDLAATGQPWRHSAREILGLAAWRAGDLEAARKYYEQIAADQEKPADLQTRADLMLSLIKARAGESQTSENEPGGEG
jgi:hypothetical protein